MKQILLYMMLLSMIGLASAEICQDIRGYEVCCPDNHPVLCDTGDLNTVMCFETGGECTNYVNNRCEKISASQVNCCKKIGDVYKSGECSSEADVDKFDMSLIVIVGIILTILFLGYIYFKSGKRKR